MSSATTPIESPRRFSLRAVLPGLAVGPVEVVTAASVGSLLFADLGQEALGRGIGFALFGSAATMAIVGWRSGTTSAMGGLQASIGAVVAVAVLRGAEAAGPDQAIATAFVIVAVTSLAIGVALFFAGSLRLAELIRYIPFPVVGGFLASTGWLATRGAINIMVGFRVGLGEVADLFDPGTLRIWLPGLVLGVSIVVLRRTFDKSWIMPTALLASFVLFWAFTLALSSKEVAEAGGWLLGPLGDTPRWIPLTPSEIGDVDWSAVVGQTVGIGSAGLIALVAILFNFSSIEIVNQVDMDANRELRTAGFANLLSGAGGGPAGYHGLMMSVLSRSTGAANRTGALVAAGVCLGAAVFAGSLVELIPRFVLGGLLISVGVGLLYDWLVVFRTRLPVAEYVLVLVIVVVMAAAGLLTGVGVGVTAAAALFAFTYSRTDAIKHRLTGAEHSSRVTRSPEQASLLRESGGRILILELQGFIFFGSSNQLLKTVRARLDAKEDHETGFVVIDFRRVRGVDSSAVLGFVKLQRMAEREAFSLVFTSIAADLLNALAQGGFDVEADSVELIRDLDHGLEWCEEHLLSSAGVALTSDESEARHLLTRLGATAEVEDRLDAYVSVQELAKGDYLIRQGEMAREMYLVLSGFFTTELELSSGAVARVARVGPGSLVGEVGLYTGEPRTASVVAATDAVVEQIDAAALEAMERDDPELAAAVHRAIVKLLSDRLTRSNDTVRALLD